MAPLVTDMWGFCTINGQYCNEQKTCYFYPICVSFEMVKMPRKRVELAS